MKDDAPPRSRDNEHSRQRRYHEARRRQPFIQHAYAGPRHPRAARQRALREELAHRSAAADAHEQSRSRGCGAAAGSGRLRRHRPRRAQLGMLRRDRRGAQGTERRRVAADPVGEADRRFQNASRCATRADRQFEPGAEVGDVGALQRARPQRPHDVWPDDRRLMDLYRQPRHRTGNLRDFRRSGPPALRRRSSRQMDPDRGLGRHGRRAAAGGDDGGRVAAGDRVPAFAHRDALEDALSGRAGARHRPGALAHR